MLDPGCDLLSNFIFDNVLTIEHWKQHLKECCDLLSNFIFDNVLTINGASIVPTVLL